MDELILAAPRATVFGNEQRTFHGFLAADDPAFEPIAVALCEATPPLHRRGDIEEDPQFLQPIPYVVLMRGESEVYAYRRLEGGGEARLHGMSSIGVGGHQGRPFSARDRFEEVLRAEALREVHEELVLPEGLDLSLTVRGFINDDSEPVQQVHIGILITATLPAGTAVEVRETEQLEGAWMTLNELQALQRTGRLEKWSGHALTALRAP